MRQRTEEKRDAILAIAAEVFREHGYERASMAEISARVGGSKTTLYGYFPSKEQLFVEVANHAAQRQLDEAFAELSLDTPDIAQALQRFGRKFMTFVVQPEALAIHRMIIARSGDTDIGQRFFSSCHKRGFSYVVKFMKSCMQTGRLRAADPLVATAHLMALLQAEIVPERMLGVSVSASPAKIQAVVSRAVGVFMAAYEGRK